MGMVHCLEHLHQLTLPIVQTKLLLFLTVIWCMLLMVYYFSHQILLFCLPFYSENFWNYVVGW